MEGEQCCTNPGSLFYGVGACNQVIQRGKISFGLGLSLGIGYRIPLSKVDLVIKPDYKFILNDLYSYMHTIHNRYVGMNFIIKLKLGTAPY